MNKETLLSLDHEFTVFTRTGQFTVTGRELDSREFNSDAVDHSLLCWCRDGLDDSEPPF